MKKVFILFVLILITGCTKGEKVICNIDGKEAEFILKGGIISSYKLNGMKKTNMEIDEINGLNFTSSKNNADGREILENYVDSLGGYCEK